MESDILLLAAGFGTRLRPLTEQMPKALLPVCGVPLLERHLDRLRNLGPRTIRRVVVNGHHLADQIRDRLQRWQRAQTAQSDVAPDWIRFSFEPEIRGTGGAIVAAAEWLQSDPFLVMNADADFDAPLAEAVAFHRAHRRAATMVLLPSPVWPNVRVAGDRVAAIVREGPIAGGLTFSGLQVLSREVIERLPAAGFHDIRDTYDQLLQRGQLGAFVWSPEDLRFVDIGTPRSYLEAHRACPPADGQRAGGRGARGLGHPDTGGFIDPGATIGAGARVSASVVFAGAVIAPGVRVHRTILGPGVVVEEPIEGLLVTTRGTRRIEP